LENLCKRGLYKRRELIRMYRFIRKFKEIDKGMTQECGGKASHLGELTKAGFNIPPGFCVISEALFYHLNQNAIHNTIFDIAETFNFEDLDDIEKKTAQIRSLIENSEVPPDLKLEILKGYHELTESAPDPLVAIRSSVAIKDSTISSFPGLMDTFHYVRGDHEIVKYVKKCWASVWSDRAAFSRKNKGIDHADALISPTVQVMINSDVAGIIFTANPMTSSREEMMVEANWGIGESVVSGQTQPDHYVLDKNTLEVKSKKIAKKSKMVAKGEGGGRQWFDIDPMKADIPTLTADQIAELGRVAVAIERHYDYPQDIEWAYEKGKLYILQSRRITTLKGH
jgi:pyruvate,water dikinase